MCNDKTPDEAKRKPLPEGHINRTTQLLEVFSEFCPDDCLIWIQAVSDEEQATLAGDRFVQIYPVMSEDRKVLSLTILVRRADGKKWRFSDEIKEAENE